MIFLSKKSTGERNANQKKNKTKNRRRVFSNRKQPTTSVDYPIIAVAVS